MSRVIGIAGMSVLQSRTAAGSMATIGLDGKLHWAGTSAALAWEGARQQECSDGMAECPQC